MGEIEFGYKEMMLSKESFEAVMRKVEKGRQKKRKFSSVVGNTDSFDELVKMLTKPFHDAFTKKVDPLDEQRREVVKNIVRGGLFFK